MHRGSGNERDGGERGRLGIDPWRMRYSLACCILDDDGDDGGDDDGADGDEDYDDNGKKMW